MTQTIIILGGGIGGLVVANLLRKSLPRGYRVVLVDREASFTFAPSFLWVMTGDRTAERISRPLALLENKGIEVIRGEVERIDPGRREAVVSGQTITGDYLVVALGVELVPETIPGLTEAGHNFYRLSGVERLRDAFAAFQGGKLLVLTSTPAYRSPATPYEAVLHLEYGCRKRKIRDATQIDMYAAESCPMGVAGPGVSSRILEMILARGVVYHISHQVVAVDPGARRVQFSNGADTGFDLLAYVPPHRAPQVVQEAGLTDESGWIPVHRSTLETRHAGVYALGDVASVPLKCGHALPKAGVFAHRQAEVVAKNIAHAITGKRKPAAFSGQGAFFLETGDGSAGFGSGNFYAEPSPQIKLRPSGRHWHAAKVLFEKEWFRRWF